MTGGGAHKLHFDSGEFLLEALKNLAEEPPVRLLLGRLLLLLDPLVSSTPITVGTNISASSFS